MDDHPNDEHEYLLEIQGMSCASCVSRLEIVLGSETSVREAQVNLAQGAALVRCTLRDATPLIDAIKKAGYSARLASSLPRRQQGLENHRMRLAITTMASFEVLAFSLVIEPNSRLSVLAAWLFATPIQFYGGWPFLARAVRAARNKTWTMDTLVTCGSLAAYLYSVSSALSGHRGAFDTSAMIITLILWGRTLEMRAKRKAGDAIGRLLECQPNTATLLEDGSEREVEASTLTVGQRVIVRPGQRIPADGIIHVGHSSADLSLLTGESVPMRMEPGSQVLAGAINIDGLLEIEVSRTGPDTRLAQIVRLIEISQTSKTNIQRLADRVASVFVPRILAVAAALYFILWFIAGQSSSEALMRAAAVLLVACPCSLGLATPVAITAGVGRAAELGILFKGADVFEAANEIDTVLIDKTGTLTEGTLTLESIVGLDGPKDAVLALAAAAERGSEHPIARAVLAAAADLGVEIPESSNHLTKVGWGVSATVETSRVRVERPHGLPRFLRAEAHNLAVRGLTYFAVWVEDQPIGLLGFSDTVREGAADAVRRLREMGLEVAIVSGDRRESVESAAREAGISRVIAEVFPEGKVEEVRKLQAAGRKVAFVGDGINDGPALAAAHVGIALSTGTDVAKDASDVLVIGNNLRSIVDGLGLARRTYRAIAENIAWAFAYNILMIPMAIVGKIPPAAAAAAMTCSSMTVMGNALRLRRFKCSLPRPTAASPFEAGLPASSATQEGSASSVTSGRSGNLVNMAQEPSSTTVQVRGVGDFVKDEANRAMKGLLRGWEHQWDF